MIQRSIVLIKMTVSKIQHIYLGLLFLILLHGMPVNASAQTPGEEEGGPKVLDEIVAKVNDEIITLTDPGITQPPENGC